MDNNDLDNELLQRDFKGIWIPKEIYLNEKLSWTEKILLVEIHSLDKGEGCFASNKYFAKFFKKSESQIKNCITKLRKLDLIKDKKFDGRKRYIEINFQEAGKPASRVLENQLPDSWVSSYQEAGKPADNNIFNNTLNNNIYSQILSLYNTICSSKLPPCAKITKKRQGHINSLLKDLDIQAIEEFFKKSIKIPFLIGKNDKGWRADFEWLINPNNALKVIEGRYDRIGVSIGRETNSEGKYNQFS